MVNNTLVSSKKISDTVKVDSYGKMAESTKEDGCMVNRVESVITATIMV